MKRSMLAEIISASVAAALAASISSCTWMPDPGSENDAFLTFRFTATKAESLPDTNSFILKVIPEGSDKPVYEGPYGERPAQLPVPAGTYEVSVRSCRFTAPAFDTPLYGDFKTVVARSGETVAVRFLCMLQNSGVRLDFSDRFRKRYPGSVRIRQEWGMLDYGYSENRTAWLFPGDTRFCYSDGTAENVLFRRSLDAGEVRRISLDATSDESRSSFSITVDTAAVRREEKIIFGEDSGDGLSMSTAFSVPSFIEAGCAGDTVWVWGYIAGAITDEGTVDFSCDTVTFDGNIALSPAPDTRDATSCIGIHLTKSAHKAELGLNSASNRASLLRRRIHIRGKACTYKKFPALTNICEYKLE